VVIGIDSLGRNAAEVMTTIRDLGERGIVLRSLREGIDASNASGRMVAGVLATLAELELELGKEQPCHRVSGAGRGERRRVTRLPQRSIDLGQHAGRSSPRDQLTCLSNHSMGTSGGRRRSYSS
jgi:DNA invertase Pin-like site-specific DNA recombinase